MNNKKVFPKKYVLLSFVVVLLVIIVATLPSNKSSCLSQEVISNQPLTNSVKIVNGITIVNGKPFFPFGFYHVSWKSTAQDLMEDMREIAAAGFNTIHASATEVKSYDLFLNEAARLGIYVFSEQGIGLLNMIDSFKKKPAVLGWSIADDVDNGKLLPEEVLKMHQQAKLADPNHITYISGYSNKIKRFGNCADAIASNLILLGMETMRYHQPTIEYLLLAVQLLLIIRLFMLTYNLFHGQVKIQTISCVYPHLMK
ncbi:MAG: hypothetical protein HC894_04575 [Microcoleus sp. SM1_3_4]|nr:hypothetical protein [Microcoleus sp. SM1_3_4]